MSDNLVDAAQGIHFHPTEKLGRRPENLAKPKLHFGDFALDVPAAPISDPQPIAISYGMDRNDQAGDCVVAGVNHALQTICAILGIPYTPWIDDQILAYYQTQNPGFKSWADAGGPNDGGMIIADFLSYLVKKGVLLAFAKVNHKNADILKAAMYLGLALVSGASLQIAQQGQKTWDYVPGSPDWGGHCTVQDAYMPYKTVSWGSDEYAMTQMFMDYCVDEVYIIITKEQWDHPAFRSNFDQVGFAKAWEAMTGRKFPAAPTPAPAPPTPPTPEPVTGGGATFLGSTAKVDQHIENAAARLRMEVPAWMNLHFTKYFLIK